ncbi:uncharacterized protein G2W53_000897 [Senna tora]|uniref:Uncharacterized protein n=1 Tax=Senna tora TaxID=362788 RepID=A0A835CM26_9FABA|nr:uncharacterized protein G2W53_000897 [Senna tora]
MASIEDGPQHGLGPSPKFGSGPRWDGRGRIPPR